MVLKGLGAQALGMGANLVAPGSGLVVNKVLGNYLDTGSLLPSGNGPLAYAFGRGTQQVLDKGLSGVQSDMQAMINSRNGFGAGIPSPMAQPAAQPTPEAWNGSLANNNPFGGQYGGNLGFATMPAVHARPIGGGLSFGGGRYNNGIGAGTGFGAANYTNDAWGDVASGFGVGGMSGGSRDQAMSSYGPTGRKTMV